MSAAAPFVRIFLRYMSGFLWGRGFIDEDVAGLIANDPQLEATIATGVAFIVEAIYMRVRQKGGST